MPPAALQFLGGLAADGGGGLASGLLGIGGALVMLPILMTWFGLPQLEPQLATLVVMLPPVGLPGVLTYALSNQLPWVAMAGVVVGLAVGAHVGARGAVRTNRGYLRQAFALLLLLIAVRTLVA